MAALTVVAFFAIVYTSVLLALWAAGYVALSDRMLWPALVVAVGTGPALYVGLRRLSGRA